MELRDKIAAGKVKALKRRKAVFEAIKKYEPVVGAYISTFEEQAMAKAKEVDEKIAAGKKVGILAGVPVAVKDNMCTTFGTTTCALKILKNFHAPYNATVVEKLLAADAVIVGKTNLDEFAMGSSTENSGLKKTVNPWDTSVFRAEAAAVQRRRSRRECVSRHWVPIRAVRFDCPHHFAA